MAIKNFCLPVLRRKAHHARWDRSGAAGGTGAPPLAPPLGQPPKPVTCFQSALWSQWWALVSALPPLQRPPMKKKRDYRAWRVPDLQGDSGHGGQSSRRKYSLPFPTAGFGGEQTFTHLTLNFYLPVGKYLQCVLKMLSS